MMIFGIALTAGVAGSFLDPWSPGRLVAWWRPSPRSP
jgi:hypothetical protein